MTLDEYNDCVRLYSDRLYGYALKCTANETTSKDVMQDVFEKLWKKRERIDFDACPSIIFKMIYNQIIDSYRYNKTRTNAVEQLKPDQSYEADKSFELKDLINKAFESLSKEYKTLVVMRDQEGYSYQEIADLMDISLSQVKVYLYRARKQLQKEIQILELTNSY